MSEINNMETEELLDRYNKLRDKITNDVLDEDLIEFEEMIRELTLREFGMVYDEEDSTQYEQAMEFIEDYCGEDTYKILLDNDIILLKIKQRLEDVAGYNTWRLSGYYTEAEPIVGILIKDNLDKLEKIIVFANITTGYDDEFEHTTKKYESKTVWSKDGEYVSELDEWLSDR